MPMVEGYRLKAEMTWKSDPEVEAARARPGWRDFHEACAKQLMFFDHIEKHGRQFVAVAVIGSGPAFKAAEERARTPIEALIAAYRASGLRVAGAEDCIARMTATTPTIDDMEDILG